MTSVMPEELYRYCRADSDEQKQLADQLAEVFEASLLSKGIPLNNNTKPRFGLAVMAMTLREMDHPGEEISPGIRGMINDLKFNH